MSAAQGGTFAIFIQHYHRSMSYSHTNSKGITYYLHSRETTLKNGRTQTIYYFGKEAKAGAIDAVPDGYQVAETANGLPVLKRQ